MRCAQNATGERRAWRRSPATVPADDDLQGLTVVDDGGEPDPQLVPSLRFLGASRRHETMYAKGGSRRIGPVHWIRSPCTRHGIETFCRFVEVALRNDRIPAIHGLGLVPDHRHGDRPRHARALEAPGGCPPEVVLDVGRDAGRQACAVPRAAKSRTCRPSGHTQTHATICCWRYEPLVGKRADELEHRLDGRQHHHAAGGPWGVIWYYASRPAPAPAEGVPTMSGGSPRLRPAP